jgi:hypothetical protein
VAVTSNLSTDSLANVDSTVFMDRLFGPTGRFSLYGPPTNIKIKERESQRDDYRLFEVSFANLSQSTNAEIPRKALVVASLPKGSPSAVLLVASATASRWKKVEQSLQETVASFRAIPAPPTSLKIRPKDRSNGSMIEF